MQFEFKEIFQELFKDGLRRLMQSTKQKMRAIVFLERKKQR